MLRSCTFIDGHGGTFDVDVEDLRTSKADQLGEDLVLNALVRYLLFMQQNIDFSFFLV
jgi:hypothetical protein